MQVLILVGALLCYARGVVGHVLFKYFNEDYAGRDEYAQEAVFEFMVFGASWFLMLLYLLRRNTKIDKILITNLVAWISFVVALLVSCFFVLSSLPP